MSNQELYGQYLIRMRKIADVNYALAVLQWDEETYLPPAGATLRGQQMATLSEISHDLFVDKELGSLLQELNGRIDVDPAQKKNVELTLEDFEKKKKYSSAFVRQLSEATSSAYHAWIDARKQNSFSVFEKPLEELVQLKRKEANILGFTQHPYDALLNEFEKGATVSWLDGLFEDIRKPLRALLDKIKGMNQVDDQFLHQNFDKDAQWKFGLEILGAIGFNFEAGRQDISEHPFTTSFNARDVRVTTRISENDFSSMTWSCIHEGGHALYEQGLPFEEYGLPSGEACSLGIHESQSRLWENSIGRSYSFLEFILPVLKKYFPQLESIQAGTLFSAINKVQPSLIRTEADELTYHFHVMIRYELEKKLIEGSLEVKDIPAYWNQAYKEYLGLQVPDDKRGCLQDIHWSHGSFGYFPTYSLGSFYAAQFFAAIEKEHAGLQDDVRMGDFEVVSHWLKTNVYRYGRLFTSAELCNKSTREPLNLKYFLNYLAGKFDQVYGMN